MKKYTLFRPRIRSRHPSHDILRAKNKTLPLLPFKSVVRLGSTSEINDLISNGGDRIECNSIESIKNSSNKLLMKKCFEAAEVKTAIFVAKEHKDDVLIEFEKKFDGEVPFPIIAKRLYGSRGKGNTKINNIDEFELFIADKNPKNFIFEKFYNYSREYRLHVTKNGCFYTCRKMLKSETPENERWFRNDSNSVWILEENKQFDKPVNWDDVISESVKALNSVGLDIGAVDLKIQSSKTSDGKKRKNPDFIIIEINSAPSFGEITSKKYIEQIPKILNNKYKNL